MKRLLPNLIGMYLNLLVYFSPRKAGKVGFYLFCTPRRMVLKDHQHVFLDSAAKSSFYCDGTRIQVYRWGHGEKKVLFLHGWQSHTFRWKNYIESFSKEKFSVYAFDAPGHGHSRGKYLNLPIYSHVLETFLNLAGPMDAIVGHSLGSFAALYTLHRVEELPVKQLVITGTPGEVNEFFEFYQKMLGLSGRSVRAIRNAFMQNIQNYPEYFSAPKFAQSILIPGLIIHDKDDEETPYHHAIAIHRDWKGSTLITTSGLGHNLRSANVVKQVVDFITRQLETQTSSPSQRDLVNKNIVQ